MEVIALLPEIKTEEAGDVSTSNVNPHDGVWHSKAFIDRDSVCHSIPRVQHNSCSPSCCVTEIKSRELDVISWIILHWQIK